MGLGFSIKVAEEQPPTPPVVGILDWLKANWPWLATGGLATALIIAITKRRK